MEELSEVIGTCGINGKSVLLLDDTDHTPGES